MIPVFKPSIRRKEMDSVLSSLVSDEIGPESVQRELVKELSELTDTAGGFALREYERAVALAIDALELERGGGVVLSALSPHTCYRVLESKGLQPLPVDVDSGTMCIDVDAVEKRVEEGARAVLVDGPLGFVPQMERIAETGVPIIEEITATLGGHTGERSCGSYGQHVIIRLEAGDLITSGGGTVVLSRKKGSLTKIKHAAEFLPKEAFLPDMNAALARIQIRELDHYFERRRELYSHFFNALRKGKHGAPVQNGEAEAVAYSFPVLVDGAVKEVQSYARKKGVETYRAFAGATISFLNENDIMEKGEFPNARRFLNSCILFPLYPRMQKTDAETVGKVLSTLP